MATAIANSAVENIQKPARSLTHPLCEQKNGSTQRRKKQSEQIDPDELRQKLEAHLAEQKRQAELRHARVIAKKEKKKEGIYHHVPKVAAAAFERTTTPVLMGGEEAKKKKSIHKLGHVALKHHVEENIRPTAGFLNLRKTLAMDHARKQRDIIGDRNQFQRTRQLEDAAKLDQERNVGKVPQRTFGLDHLDLPQKVLYSQPLSTGDLHWEEDLDAGDILSHNKLKANANLVKPVSDRQDWEQRDEVPTEVHRSVKERVSPFLRKADSMWILKSKEPKVAVVSEMSRSAPTGETKQKKKFLGRFKR